MKLITTAACLPARKLRAKSHFGRPSAMGPDAALGKVVVFALQRLIESGMVG